MAMVGPFTPTLLALLTRSGKLTLPTLRKAAPASAKTREAREAGAFRGKVAVITGAASGIGAALAKTCRREGVRALVLADNAWASGDPTPGGGEEQAVCNPDDHPLVQELRGCGADRGSESVAAAADSAADPVQVLALQIDVASKEDLQRLHDETLRAFGAPHLLFNNAGTGMPGVLSASDDALVRSFDINFWSVIHAMRLFIPSMEKAAAKSIASTHSDAEPADPDPEDICHVVNTASLAGISEACGLYGVTKHSVVAATEAVSSELAWRNSNVRVSVLCPSYVASNVAKTTVRSQLNKPPPEPSSISMNVLWILAPKGITRTASPTSDAASSFSGSDSEPPGVGGRCA